MMMPKRRLLTLTFACLCFKKSLLIKTLNSLRHGKYTSLNLQLSEKPLHALGVHFCYDKQPQPKTLF